MSALMHEESEVKGDQETQRRAAYRAGRDGPGLQAAPGMMSQAGYESSQMWQVSFEMLATVRNDGLLQQVNPRWEEILGWTEAEILERPFLEFVHPEDQESCSAEAAKLLQPGYETVSFESRARCRDGSYRWLVWNARASIDDDLIYAAGHDVTERKEQQAALEATGEELRLLSAELESRVDARTSELAAANAEIEAFSYSVSHDLRAPLRAIDGFSKAVLEDYAEVLPDGAKADLARVRAASQRMALMIDEMLALSRLTRRELKGGEVDLSAEAIEVAEELRSQAEGREVVVDVEPGLVTIGDPVLLRQVVHNLLENAWKFTAGVESAHVEFFRAGEEGGLPTFAVRDNGAGFDMRYADKLFRPFERLHGQAEFSGTGVGLATVARILARHGGAIRGEGIPGAGATMYFSLPDGAQQNG